ncbi:MAG: UDP-N-acetylglucosamine 1-carboxyvinyltransferase [Clostridia bacterium]|nr:UDP-N-acetylglucosamine 1-carboxyvinyltransferase [Clostridia bacterium]
MHKLVIEGRRPLCGTVAVHGAKNSALPLLAATLLMSSPVVLDRCPPLTDVAASAAILRHLGCTVCRRGDAVEVSPSSACRADIPEELMREMRSSIVFLGAMLAKAGEAHLCFPGGCELGPRPIDLHLAALSQMGVTVQTEGDMLSCRAPDGLKGAAVTLSFPSVGATENILLAAVLAKGETVICNAAREPEIVDLCRFLNTCGAQITGGGESVIRVQGVPRLIGCRYEVMPDRIEAATYLAAAAVTGGDITLTQVRPHDLSAVLSVFEEAGCTLIGDRDRLRLKAPERLQRLKTVRTMPYPGFPTDAQAPVMAMTAVADGTSVFVENMFDSRYKHVSGLLRMGARIKTEGRAAIVEGVKRLHGAKVCCTDLRGGAALLVAALAADGVTEIDRLCHLDRGYVAPEDTLRQLGAEIRRIEC